MKKIRLTAFIATIAIMTSALPASADESFEPVDGVNVMDATATPAAVGETTRLHFILENFSSSDLVLTGVRSEAAESGAIFVSDGAGGGGVTSQLLIKQEETLDFVTSHVWLELGGVRRELEEGGILPFTLVFRSGALSGRAHVHAAPH